MNIVTFIIKIIKGGSKMKNLILAVLILAIALSCCACGISAFGMSDSQPSAGSQESDLKELDSQESGLQEVDLKGSDPQEELRQKFEDCIKITEAFCETGEGRIDSFPFEVTFYKPDDEPEESENHIHYYQLMFRLKEKFKEYTTYKIRIFTDYYNEELCNSGECDSEYIFSTTAVRYCRPFRISYELYGEGMEPLISGDELWSFLYSYIDNSIEQYGDDSLDDSKPIKVIFSDGDTFF